MTYAVELKDVSLKYNDQSVLDDVKLKIEDKDFMAIIGPNGGGKTTLLKIILGVMKPDYGEVMVYGQEPAHARKIIGYLPQNISFDHDFPINVFNTVLSGRYHGLFKGYNEEDNIAVMKALKDMNISELETVNMLPNRYEKRSGAYPGVRLMNIIPIAIPTLQSIPIAVSSLILTLSRMVPIPIAATILNGMAASMGFIPI